MFFLNVDKKIFEVSNVIEELTKFAKENANHEFEMLVGSDSQRKGKKVTHVTGIFLWDLETRKFKFFYNKEVMKYNYRPDLYQRILNEVTRSLEVVRYFEGSELMDLIGHDNFEVHIDVGKRGKSKSLIPTVTGMVKGSGYNYQIKPDSWLANSVCDRLIKKGLK